MSSSKTLAIREQKKDKHQKLKFCDKIKNCNRFILRKIVVSIPMFKDKIKNWCDEVGLKFDEQFMIAFQNEQDSFTGL